MAAPAPQAYVSFQLRNDCPTYWPWRTLVQFFLIVSTVCKDFPKEKDVVLLVDIGGGKEYDLEVFKARFRTLPGRLILKDLPQVIESITAFPMVIEPLKYEFSIPQPVNDT